MVILTIDLVLSNIFFTILLFGNSYIHTNTQMEYIYSDKKLDVNMIGISSFRFNQIITYYYSFSVFSIFRKSIYIIIT